MEASKPQRTVAEEIMIVLEFLKLKNKYNLSNFEVNINCKMITKPVSERERYLVQKAISRGIDEIQRNGSN